jgi:hypothetical protein
MSRRARRVVLKLLIEYILVTLPILVYVLLEAFAHANPLFLFTSPEWSIATIFLTLQMIRICLEGLRDVTGRLLNHLLVIALVAITLCGSVNIYVSLQAPPSFLSLPMIVKWGLFAIATALFVYIAGAAIYASEPKK